jgi:hypothetical protein
VVIAAENLMGHIVAARQMWLHRLGNLIERPANIFPTDVNRDELLAALEVVERAWSDYCPASTRLFMMVWN